MNLSEFKNILSSINEIIYFVINDCLREKCSNHSQLKQIISVAENLLESTKDDEEKYFLMGTLGNLNRIFGEPQKAINSLTYCFTQASIQKNINREIVSLIRLGEAFKYKGNRSRALEIFDDVIDKCKDKNKIKGQFSP